jgi:hypothetical protein
MKKTALILSLFLASSLAFGQTKVMRDSSGNFKTISAPSKAREDKNTGSTFTAANGETYPVYESVNGKLYVIRTSKNGNQYRQYLKTESN